MTVEDGPAHIDSDGHKARLAQFNASALASRIKELTLLYSSLSKEPISILPVAHVNQQCEITDRAHVSADTFTHTQFSAIPLVLQRTVEATQTKAKLWNAVTAPTPPSTLLWTCTLCNREMQDVSKVNHLAGKAHARKLIHVNSTILGTPEVNKIKEKRIAQSNSTANHLAQSWTCPSCNVVITFRQKASHSCPSSDSKPSTIDGPLDDFFHFYHSFHYDASTPPAISFESLQKYLQKRHKWSRESPECKELWHCYQAALTQEFNLWFGIEDDLDAWHSLCRAVRITPLPTTCELCRSVGLPHPVFQMRGC